MSECRAYYGTGIKAAPTAICRRPKGHPPISEDGIGHRPTPTPQHAFRLGMLGLCHFGAGTDAACAMPRDADVHVDGEGVVTPDEAYQALRLAIQNEQISGDGSYAEEISELFTALDEWAKQGFLPKAWQQS